MGKVQVVEGVASEVARAMEAADWVALCPK